jgi:hypothetical protein
MLELPGATRKLSSNSAKRMRLRSAWVSARSDGGETGVMELRQALVAYTDEENKFLVPFFQGLLAEIKAQDDADGALSGRTE